MHRRPSSSHSSQAVLLSPQLLHQDTIEGWPPHPPAAVGTTLTYVKRLSDAILSSSPSSFRSTYSALSEHSIPVTIENVANAEKLFDKYNTEWHESTMRLREAQTELKDITETKECLLHSVHELLTSQELNKRKLIWDLLSCGLWTYHLPPHYYTSSTCLPPHLVKLPFLAPQIVSLLHTMQQPL
eukprot:GHVQ01033782.1.p1 GENE.GHVQ01033782.1~~GHVQ01033782.1.p1  ORF type:complete len:185 (+),score=36.29 GHVQ01033782.1:552-1106(+)